MDEVYNAVHHSILKNDSFRESLYWMFQMQKNMDTIDTTHLYHCFMDYLIKYVNVFHCKSIITLRMSMHKQRLFEKSKCDLNDRVKMISIDLWTLNTKNTSPLFLNMYFDSLNTLVYKYKTNEIIDLCNFIRTMNMNNDNRIELEMELKSLFYEMQPHVKNKYQSDLSIPLENNLKYTMYILQCSQNIKQSIIQTTNNTVKQSTKNNMDKYEKTCFLLCHLTYCAIITEKRKLKANFFTQIQKFAKNDPSKRMFVDMTIFSLDKKTEHSERMSHIFSSPEIVIWYSLLCVNQNDNEIWSIILFLLDFYVCFSKSSIVYDNDHTKNSYTDHHQKRISCNDMDYNSKIPILFYAIHCHFNHFKSKCGESSINTIIKNKTDIVEKMCENSSQYYMKLKQMFRQKNKKSLQSIHKDRFTYEIEKPCINMFTERGCKIMDQSLIDCTVKNACFENDDNDSIAQFCDKKLNEMDQNMLDNDNDTLFFNQVIPNEMDKKKSKIFVFKKDKISLMEPYEQSIDSNEMIQKNTKILIQKSHSDFKNTDTSLYTLHVHTVYEKMHSNVIGLIGHKSIIKNSNNKQINKNFTNSSLTKSISNLAEYEAENTKIQKNYEKDNLKHDNKRKRKDNTENSKNKRIKKTK